MGSDVLPVELDVVQDSMPMMEKVPKKKNKQPKVMTLCVYTYYVPVSTYGTFKTTLAYIALIAGCVSTILYVSAYQTTKGNTTAKCAPPKRSRSPGWTLNLSTRSLTTAGSANVSRTSTAMDQDPYQFDSDDVTGQLQVPLQKRVTKKPSKWHEKDTSAKSTKKVYSNKVCTVHCELDI